MTDAERSIRLFELLSLDMKLDRVISVVGSGGKTTLIRALARAAKALAITIPRDDARDGASYIAVTTTTHILRPSDSDFFVCANGDIPALASSITAQEKIIVAGSPASDGKLCAPDDQTFEWLSEHCAPLLIEADGSRGLPIKLPAAHEPVIPPQTDRVIAVAGMSALGQPLSRCCHRAESAAELLGIPVFAAVTSEMIASLLLHGYRKYNPVAVLTASGLPPMLAHDISRVREILLAGGISTVAVM